MPPDALPGEPLPMPPEALPVFRGPPPLLLLLPPRCAPDALPGFGGPSPSCAAPAGGAARAGVASCMPSRAPLSSGPPPSAATAASALPSAAEAAPLGKTACRPSEGAAAGQAPAPKEAPDALASTPVSAPAGATAVPVASGSTMRPLRERSSAPPTCWLTSTSHASPCGRGGRHALHTLLLQRIDQRADSAGCAGVVPVVHRLGHWRAGRAAAADATAAAVAAAAATAAATTPAAAAIAAAAKASSSNIATTSRAILGNMIQAGDGKLVCANVLSKTQILGNVIQAGDGDFVCAAILSNPQPLGNGLQSSDGDNVRVNVLSKTQLLGHGVDLLREALRRGLDELPCSYQRRVGVRRQLLHRARPNKPTAAAAVEAANVAVAGNAGQRRRAQVIFSISAAVDAGGDGSCSSSSSSSGGSGCSCDIAVLKRHDPVRSAKALASQAAPGGRRAAPAACAALAASVLDGVHRAECADAKRAAVPRLLGSCHRGIVRCAQFLECGLQRPPQRLAPLVDGTALGRRVGGGVRLASLAELLCAERQHADLDCTRHLRQLRARGGRWVRAPEHAGGRGCQCRQSSQVSRQFVLAGTRVVERGVNGGVFAPLGQAGQAPQVNVWGSMFAQQGRAR
eukprot:361716-Chlamydomonas_euryale.AAC.2